MDDYSERYLEEALPSEFTLEDLRTHLADVYTSRENEVPETFTRVKVQQETERNIYEGFRVQIYSGQNVDHADSIAADFRVWSDSTITGYQAETYVSFRTPYYKVHVGDFHDRDNAITFSNLLKRNFREAWVVYDNVNPSQVPADTVQIELK
ncbi:MAG: SPOR domain-containing protein [Balneolaceae bacterium]